MASREEQVREFYKGLSDTEAFEPIKKAVDKVIDGIFIEGKLLKDAMGISTAKMEKFYAQGLNYYKSGRYKDAAKIFQMLAGLDPTSMKYILGIAACHHMKKDYARAVAMYHMCGTADPTDPVPYYHMSDCYSKLGATDASLQCLKLVLKYSGNNPKYVEIRRRAQMMVTSKMKEKPLSLTPEL